MEALSSTVTTHHQIPGFPSTTTTREFKPYLFPPIHHHKHNSSISKTFTRPTSSSSSSITNNKTFITSTTTPFTSSAPTYFSSHKPSPTRPVDAAGVHHRKPATGYAAALLDRARCNDALHVVERDIRRFLKLLRSDELRALLMDKLVDDDTKGGAIKELAVKGRFQKHLVMMVKMLVDKSKIEMVYEVFEEFGRIYDELCGTRVVLVSSEKKMEEAQLFGIAKRVQTMSGALKVKVKNLVHHQSLPSSIAV